MQNKQGFLARAWQRLRELFENKRHDGDDGDARTQEPPINPDVEGEGSYSASRKYYEGVQRTTEREGEEATRGPQHR